MKRLFDNSLSDPCSASHFSRLDVDAHRGIGSRLNLLVNDIWLPAYAIALETAQGQAGSHTWALCWEHMGFRDTWKAMFSLESIPECTDWSRCGGTQLKHDTHEWTYDLIRNLVKEVEARFGQDGARIVSEQKASVLGFFVAYVPERESWSTHQRQLAGLSDGEPYIGVHIRHGDKVTEAQPVATGNYADRIFDVPGVEGRMNLQCRSVRSRMEMCPLLAEESEESYHGMLAARVLEETERRGISKVFLASDDPTALQAMRDKLRDQLEVTGLPRLDISTYADRKYQDRKTFEAVVADVDLLSRSTIFIGTGTSNLGRIVFLHRGGNLDTSISMDAPFTCFGW